MSRIFMLKPADGKGGIKKSVIQAVKDARTLMPATIVVGVGWVEVLKSSISS